MNKILAHMTAIALSMVQLLSGLTYSQESIQLSGPQNIYTIEADIKSGDIFVDQALSHDLFYGVEKTSEMAARHQAVVAVNGMFYTDSGMTSGIIIHKGIPLSTKSIWTPVIMFGENGECAINELSVYGYMKIGNEKIYLQGVNQPVYNGEAVMFTPDYGKTTRIRRTSQNYCIKDGRLVRIVVTDQPVVLSEYDYVISTVGSTRTYSVREGDLCEPKFTYTFTDFPISEAFQSGGWLVKNSEVVAQDYESFIGYTSAPAPRTLLGVKEDGTLVIKVVDGRNQGTSTGLSGGDAGKLMQEAGCVAAVYLDGGASSTMVVQGNIVNQPSEGTERQVAHAILLKYKNSGY